MLTGLAFCCASGLTADGRQIVNRAREEAESYKDNYGSDIPPGGEWMMQQGASTRRSTSHDEGRGPDLFILGLFAVLADRLAQFMHYFTLYASLRPFGASAIVGGYDPYTGNHEMYMIEPSGTNYVSGTDGMLPVVRRTAGVVPE